MSCLTPWSADSWKLVPGFPRLCLHPAPSFPFTDSAMSFHRKNLSQESDYMLGPGSPLCKCQNSLSRVGDLGTGALVYPNVGLSSEMPNPWHLLLPLHPGTAGVQVVEARPPGGCQAVLSYSLSLQSAIVPGPRDSRVQEYGFKGDGKLGKLIKGKHIPHQAMLLKVWSV